MDLYKVGSAIPSTKEDITDRSSAGTPSSALAPVCLLLPQHGDIGLPPGIQAILRGQQEHVPSRSDR